MVFEAFRRRQKTFLAFLAIAAMFAFILGGTLSTMNRGPSGDGPVAHAWGHPINASEVSKLHEHRREINEFLRRAYILSGIQPTFPGFSTDSSDQLLADLVMERKAKNLGISATDEDAKKWLKDVTQNRLSEADIASILDSTANDKLSAAIGEEIEPLQLPVEALFDGLKRELVIRRAIEATVPPVIAELDTPLNAWERASPTLTEIRLEFVDVPVKKFVDPSSQPTEEQIQETYTRLKFVEANPATGTLGFMQPRKVNVQYLEGKVDDFLKDIPVSDEEIAKYYEEHKNEFVETPKPEIVPPPPTPPAPSNSPTPPSDAPKDGVKPETPPPSPPPPTEPEKKEPASPTSPGEAPKPPEPSPEKKSGGDAAPAPQNLHSRHSVPADFRGGLIVAATQTALGTLSAMEQAPTPPAAPPDPPAPPPDSEPKPPEPPVKDAPMPPPAERDGNPAAPPATPPNPAQSPAEKPADDAATTTPPTASPAAPAEPAKAPPEPKIKPLEQVREEIRKILQREKASPVVQEKMQSIIDTVMAPYWSSKYRPAELQWKIAHPKDNSASFQPPDLPDLAKIAEANHFQLKSTGPLTSSQLEQIEGLAQSTRVDKRAKLPENFGKLVFGPEIGTDLYNPRMVFDGKSNTYYTFWKTADLPPEPAPLDTIREQVIAAWREENAAKKAKEMADQLAAKAREASGNLAAGLAQGSDFKVEKSDRFPQLRVFSIPEQGDFALPVTIPQIPGADSDFIAEAFKLKQGEITVIPDAKKENYYVVKVAERVEPDFAAFAREYRKAQQNRRQQASRTPNQLVSRMYMQSLEEASLDKPLFKPVTSQATNGKDEKK